MVEGQSRLTALLPIPRRARPSLVPLVPIPTVRGVLTENSIGVVRAHLVLAGKGAALGVLAPAAGGGAWGLVLEIHYGLTGTGSLVWNTMGGRDAGYKEARRWQRVVEPNGERMKEPKEADGKR